MIEKIASRQQDTKNNPYRIQEIFLIKESDNFYIAFSFKTEKEMNTFFSAIDRLRTLLKDSMMNKKINFSFAKETHMLKDVPKHNVALKGNISEAVNALILNRILAGNNRMLFQDEEDEAIQAFLRESTKFVVSDKSQKPDSLDSNSKLSSKGCTLL